MKDEEKIDCFRCVHFAVTWQPGMPRGCRLFGFKSAELPSAVVYKSTGAKCEGFEKKR